MYAERCNGSKMGRRLDGLAAMEYDEEQTLLLAIGHTVGSVPRAAGTMGHQRLSHATRWMTGDRSKRLRVRHQNATRSSAQDEGLKCDTVLLLKPQGE